MSNTSYTQMSGIDKRNEALKFAIGFTDCNTVATCLSNAADILRFMNESPGDFELHASALMSARTIAVRWEDGLPEAYLISDAKVILDFLNGSTSSEHPNPCATAEPRSEVE